MINDYITYILLHRPDKHKPPFLYALLIDIFCMLQFYEGFGVTTTFFFIVELPAQ